MQQQNIFKLKLIAALVASTFGAPHLASAAEAEADQASSAQINLDRVEVISTTPLPSIGLPLEKIPANVQTVQDEDFERQNSLTIADYMSQNLTGVNVNDTQNNPFQPNVNYRGFTASPLLGTPQGLSVFYDGVRINEPFGDVVSWDLIPVNAINHMALIPGSNPVFGLNTLGGAISLQTKSGRTNPGGAVEASVGSWSRSNAQAEYGGVLDNGVDYFFAGNTFEEDGWRDHSPTEVHQLFGKVGWQNETTDLSLSLTAADTNMIGNGLTQKQLLDSLGYEAINTRPDQTENKLVMWNFTGSHWITDDVMFSGNAYYRKVRTRTLNGDVNDDVDEALFDPNCATAANPEEGCGGALNRSNSRRSGYGFTAQLTFAQDLFEHANQFTAGLGYDYGRTRFRQSTEFGDIVDFDRGVIGAGIFSDEAPVEMEGKNRTWSVFATDTFSINDLTHLTLSGRYNYTRVENYDYLNPVPDPVMANNESLTATHSFNRINPAIGLTITPNEAISFYGSYNEGSRAPTAIELGCANPDQPCKLPNAMAGDPPLDQVVSKTFEGGIRGALSPSVNYTASIYRTQNTDDIQFIASNSTGAGYFDNVGKTRRVGVDLGLNGNQGKFNWFAGYSYIKATYETDFTLVNEVNSTAVNDTIQVSSGDNIPGIPRHQFKFRGEYQATANWSVGTNLIAFSDQYSHGNENNDHEGEGDKVSGYTIVNLDTRYSFGDSGWQVFAKAINIFDREYYSGGMLGENFFNPDGSFMGGEDEPAGLYAPGAPRAGWIGVRYAFGGKK